MMTDIREPLARARGKGNAPDADDDVSMAKWLATQIGVAAVPGSGFYRAGTGGRDCLRFCFCKKEETLAAAEERLLGAFLES